MILMGPKLGRVEKKGHSLGQVGQRLFDFVRRGRFQRKPWRWIGHYADSLWIDAEKALHLLRPGSRPCYYEGGATGRLTVMVLSVLPFRPPDFREKRLLAMLQVPDINKIRLNCG